jgi:hypothetical protein
LAGVLLHCLGVLAEPLRFFSRSEVDTAPEFSLLRETLKPYSQWLYLDHGYFFFAPNPGPSHLVQVQTSRNIAAPEEKSRDSTPPDPKDTFVFPDRKRNWPRLRYHRYFMLSEFYNSRFAPKHITEELRKDESFVAQWTFDRALYDQIQNSIIQSLSFKTGSPNIELRRIERLLPDRQQILGDRWPLDDPRLTETLPESMPSPASKASPSPDELPSQTQTEVAP